MIGFFSIALLVVVVGIIGFVNSLRINAAFNAVANEKLPELVALGNIQSSVNKISSDIVGFALVSQAAKPLHQERLQQMTRDSKTLTTLVDQLGKIDAESYPILRHLTSAYSTLSLQLINSKDSGMNEQSILNLISSASDTSSKIEMTINQRISMKNAELQNEIAKANESILTQQEEIIIASIAACVASLLIGRHLSLNSIIKPLLKLKQATIQMAHGDFGFVEMTGHGRSDEIGELSMQFDSMRQILNQRTRELKSSNTRLSLANDQLKEHDKMQRDFINIAAHELRAPMEPLLLGSEELKRRLPNEEVVSIIHRNAKKLQTLAGDILDAARIESSTFKLYKERVNIKNIISNALQVTNSSCNEDKLNIMYEPRDIFVEADKDRITQVISNLLSNAVKFTERGGIFVVAEQKKNPDEVIVSIKDTGKGIDPEIRSRLFTKFATKSFDGTGLGLYISKSIIEAHGGKIWAEDNDNGGKKGAAFSFSLPVSLPSTRHHHREKGS
jgi:signal transduction histidine kinase